MKKIYLDKAGVALVLVLMIVVMSAGLLAAIMYYALSGTEISGLQRKYETSREASLGAIDVFTKELIPRSMMFMSLSTAASSINDPTGIVGSITPLSGNDACFVAKLTKPSACWRAGCDATVCADYLPCGTCGATAADVAPDPTSRPDITFNLLSTAGSTRPYVVEAKIIDTIFGNSETGGKTLAGTGVVESGVGQIDPQKFPYLYTIVVQGQQGTSGSNTTERANLEILYAY